MKKALLAAAALTASAGFAFAQAPDFTAVDTDASGTVTMEEAKAAMPDITEEAFVAADTDQSGDLSADEYAAMAG